LLQVGAFVKPFNEDAHRFIQRAADLVLEASSRNDCAVLSPSKVSKKTTGARPEAVKVPVPPTISHFVMNLPASAIDFLHNFKGLYSGHEKLFAPFTATELPIIHVHCFAVKSEDSTPLEDICMRIEHEIGVKLRPGDVEKQGEVYIHDVRDVAPAKRMFCASFRLPAEVAYASRA
jgi:tRNA (guanine37-N1)-methyltransferase